jgi:hypothetical protein
MTSVGIDPEGPVGTIEAKSKRSLRRNRWAAEVSAQIAPHPNGSAVRWQVDMVGTKHFEILDEIADHLPDGLLDDRGIEAAVERLGLHRVFGRKEIRHLHNMLTADEAVLVLGQGQYGNKQGILVLTTSRLFFFEKSLLTTESVDEFPLSSISSLSVHKSRGGETLVVHSSGNNVEIRHMRPGNADAIARALRELRDRTSESPSQAMPGGPPNVLEQIEQLAGLRDKGIISAEDFEQKKTELLGRL